MTEPWLDGGNLVAGSERHTYLGSATSQQTAELSRRGEKLHVWLGLCFASPLLCQQIILEGALTRVHHVIPTSGDIAW